MRNASLIFISLLIFSCQLNNELNTKTDKEGGTLRINEAKTISTLYPPLIPDNTSAHIAFQIHEGLVKFNTKKPLKVLPAIAHSWEVDDTSQTVYTFHLRNDVYFHEDDCFNGKQRKVVANDFLYTFKLFSTKGENNRNFHGAFKQIKGASTYYDSSSATNNIEGIKVINDSTFQLTLEKANPFFLTFLAHPVAAVVLAKEANDKYGINNHIGTGPYELVKFDKKEKNIALKRNSNYYKTDQKGIKLPYIDEIIISFIGSARKELMFIEQNKLDIVMELPEEFVKDFLSTNIDKFQNDPPELVLNESGNNFTILRSNVNDFIYVDNIMDLSFVYLMEAKPRKVVQIQ